MNRVFKQTLIFATLLTLAIFALQFLLAVTNILLALAGAIIGLGSVIPGSSNSFVAVQSILQLVILILLIALLIFIIKNFGGKFLGDGSLKGVLKKSMKAPFDSLGKTGKQGMNFMRGLRHLNQKELREFAFRRNFLGGNGRAGRLLNKGIRAKDDLDMMKSIAEKGADGKKRKDNLKELAKKGLTPKDTRDQAQSLVDSKKKARLANLGVDEKMWSKLGDDDKRKISNIADRDNMSLEEKRDAVKKIRVDNLKRTRDAAGLDTPDEMVEQLADRKHNAAIAHGQKLSQHVDGAVETLEKNNVKVYDDHGNEMSAKDYVEKQDDRAIRTSDKFRESHKETLGSYGAAQVAGATTAMYALDISRTNEENRNSTVNGSLNPAYIQPVSSSEERETDHAARVHGRIPVDEEVAAKHAEKAAKEMSDVAATDVGFKSTGEAPVGEDKVARDENGRAIPSFVSNNDDYKQMAESINTGSPYGTMLPLSLTEDFDPKNMTEEQIAEAAQGNLEKYASGTFNPAVMSGTFTSDEIDNAFASEPLTAQSMYGYQQNAGLNEGAARAAVIEDTGGSTAATINDGLESAFSDDDAFASLREPSAPYEDRDPYDGRSQQIIDEERRFREEQQLRNDELRQRQEQMLRDEEDRRMQQMDAVDQMFGGGSTATSASMPIPAQVNDSFQTAWSSGNPADMSGSINDLAQSIGVKHSMELGIPQDSQDKLNDLVRQYQSDLDAGMFQSMDSAQARIRDIASFAAGSISTESVRSMQRSETESKDAEKRVMDAQNMLSDSLSDMLAEVSRETMNRKAEAEEEERRRRGTDGIRNTGNAGRLKR